MKLSSYRTDRINPKARDSFGLLTHRLEQAWLDGFTPTWFRPRWVETQYGWSVTYGPWDGQAWASGNFDQPSDWEFLFAAAVAAGLCPIGRTGGRVDHPVWVAHGHHVT